MSERDVLSFILTVIIVMLLLSFTVIFASGAYVLAHYAFTL